MDRSIIYSQEVGRSFDFVENSHDVLRGLANAMQDALGGTTAVVGGLAATPDSTADMNVNLATGRIYQLADADAVAVGAIPQDTTQILQQGSAAAQTLTLTTAALTSGQSQWVLIEAAFSQVDAIRANDPNGGLLPYYNSANPSVPFQGPNGSGQIQDTVRQGVCVIKAVYGTPAATGSEVPPSADTGYVGLYLIDLTYGQTQITSAEILVAGPSVGTGVPSNYPVAPFLAGLLHSHHDGNPGQAPKIILTNALEVQGVLPAANVDPGLVSPTGILLPFAGPAANVPSGWLLAYGQAVSRTTYSTLFNVIGTTWGAGDGSTTFNLPDMRGNVAAGADNMGGTAAGRLGSGETGGITGTAALGVSGGEQGHTLSTAELAVHNHGVTDPEHSHGAGAGGSFLVENPMANWSIPSGSAWSYQANTGAAATGITIQNAGSGNAHNNVQPTAVINYIIKT